MHACAGHFAGGKQARQRRACEDVGFHTAHHVMRRWSDGNQIARQIKASGAAGGRDGREACMNPVGVEMLQREKHPGAGAFDFAHDRPRNQITRGELPRRFVARHESFAALVDEPRPSPRSASDNRNRGAPGTR